MIIWREFPEINRKIHLNFNKSVSGPGSAGCHCGLVSGFNLYLRRGIAGDPSIKKIKDDNIPIEDYVTDMFGYTFSPTEEKLVVEYLKDVKYGDNGRVITDDMYSEVVKESSRLPIWVLSDCINWEAPARSGKTPPDTYDSRQNQLYFPFKVWIRTYHFAKYLIDNKCGYVLESPIVQNPNHRMYTAYSFNQAWIWIPPEHLKRSVNVAKAHGEDQFPLHEEWVNTISDDVKAGVTPLYSGRTKHVRPDMKNLSKEMFEDGRFPVSALFQRSDEK